MAKDQISIRLHKAKMMGLSMDKLLERTCDAITRQNVSQYEQKWEEKSNERIYITLIPR